MIFVTGGCGFIGSNFILEWVKVSDEPILNIDKISYAGNPENLASLSQNSNYIFVRQDISFRNEIRELFTKYKPRAILNFAAESHVDNSISFPEKFIQTNIVGTFNLLEEAKVYVNELPELKKKAFRFLHLSTDEVFGSLVSDEPAFSESSRFAPNSPYSASKASSDHIVRAYFQTYKVPSITVNSSTRVNPRAPGAETQLRAAGERDEE